jgi:futalosine hydrolase
VNLLIAASTELECELVRAHARTIVTGVGQVNMAHSLTLAIEQERPESIVVIGIGGAYPNSGLAIGDVVCAVSETFGDLGVETPDGFLELKEFLQTAFPLQIFPGVRRAKFVTVSTCTGTDELTRRIQARTQGEVENMEGAAAAQIGARYGIPVAEIRGISNMTGHRDRALWKIPEAARAAQETLLSWLAAEPIRSA